MRGRDDVKQAVQTLYDAMHQDLRGLDGSKLVDEVLAEKDQTIEELRLALRAKGQLEGQLETAKRKLRRSLPARVLRKAGVFRLVRQTVLGLGSPRA